MGVINNSQVKVNSILTSGRKDETLTYTKYIKDEESGKSVQQQLDEKVNVFDELETSQIKDRAITNPKLADSSVDSRVIQEASVENKHLANDSVSTNKIQDGSVTNLKLADNTMSIDKLDKQLRETLEAATGLPENLIETIQDVDTTLTNHQEQLDDKQKQIDDKQQQIIDNKSKQDEKNSSLDDDIAKLGTRSSQIEESLKSIAATGGASVASAVTYDNAASGLVSVTAQGALDELGTQHVFLSEDEYNALEKKDSSKIYLLYEEE